MTRNSVVHVLKPLLYAIFILHTFFWLIAGVALFMNIPVQNFYHSELSLTFRELWIDNALKVGIRVVCFLGGIAILYFMIKAITNKTYKRKQIYREILLSISTILASFIVMLLPVYLWQQGYTVFHQDMSAYSVWVSPLVVFLGLLIYDVNSYFVHRLLHRPWWFKKIHYLHHRSVQINVLSAFSMHPLEIILLQIGMLINLCLLPLILPVSYAAGITIAVLVYTHALYIHCGLELVPPKLQQWFPFKYINTYQAHELHHTYSGKVNFALITCVLDKYFKTLVGEQHERAVQPVDTNDPLAFVIGCCPAKARNIPQDPYEDTFYFKKIA